MQGVLRGSTQKEAVSIRCAPARARRLEGARPTVPRGNHILDRHRTAAQRNRYHRTPVTRRRRLHPANLDVLFHRAHDRRWRLARASGGLRARTDRARILLGLALLGGGAAAAADRESRLGRKDRHAPERAALPRRRRRVVHALLRDTTAWQRAALGDGTQAWPARARWGALTLAALVRAASIAGPSFVWQRMR